MPGARVDLASKRVTVEWNKRALEPPTILERLAALGYPALLPRRREQRRKGGGTAALALSQHRRFRRDEREAALGLALGGADSDPNSPARDLFHWLSALIALPCARYAGMRST